MMYIDTKIYLDIFVLRQVLVAGGSIEFQSKILHIEKSNKQANQRGSAGQHMHLVVDVPAVSHRKNVAEIVGIDLVKRT
jgi:hypothetical protein